MPRRTKKKVFRRKSKNSKKSKRSKRSSLRKTKQCGGWGPPQILPKSNPEYQLGGWGEPIPQPNKENKTLQVGGWGTPRKEPD